MKKIKEAFFSLSKKVKAKHLGEAARMLYEQLELIRDIGISLDNGLELIVDLVEAARGQAGIAMIAFYRI